MTQHVQVIITKWPYYILHLSNVTKYLSQADRPQRQPDRRERPETVPQKLGRPQGAEAPDRLGVKVDVAKNVTIDVQNRRTNGQRRSIRLARGNG